MTHDQVLLVRAKRSRQQVLGYFLSVQAFTECILGELADIKWTLQIVDTECDRALRQINLTKVFCEECITIANCDSLDEMVRRRDQLIADRRVARESGL